MHLNHYLAQTGLCSRRNAVTLIEQGLIAINGKYITEPHYQVQKTDAVVYKGKKLTPQSKTYILLNKPVGYVSTTEDELGRKTIFDLVPKKGKLFSIGRLDKETSGLIILTNDGQLANTIAHPRYSIYKTYAATLDRQLDYHDLLRIKNGIKLEDGFIKVDKVTYASRANHKTVYVTISSGKKRIIRRIFGSLDYQVYFLDRINVAGIGKKGLKSGAWRNLTAYEVKKLIAQEKHQNADCC